MAAIDRSSKLEDLVRVLNLVQYWQQHPGVAMSTAAADLGVDIQQLKQDSFLLTTCGFGQYPDELFDLKVENRGVEVINALGLDAPLRLTPLEAGSLLLTMQTLQQMPGLAPTEVVQQVCAKLQAHIDEQQRSGEVFRIGVLDEPLAPESVLATITEAMRSKRQLAFDYRNSVGEQRHFQASVAKVLSTKGATYIKAYVHALNEHRTFRADRMTAVETLDAAAAPHMHLPSAQFDADDVFGFHQVRERALIALRPEHTWILDDIETLRVRSVGEHIEAEVPMPSREWLERFLLHHADRVRVVSPEHLAQSLAQRARDALSAYDDHS